MELGNGLIGHLLSRPNPTLSPFAPVIRRRRPANNTSPLLSSPFFFFFFLLSLPRSTRDACTRRGGRRTTVDARTQSFPSSSTTCQVDENDDGPADARPGEALEFSTGDYRAFAAIALEKMVVQEGRSLLWLYNWKTFRTFVRGAVFLPLLFFPRLFPSFFVSRPITSRNEIANAEHDRPLKPNR